MRLDFPIYLYISIKDKRIAKLNLTSQYPDLTQKIKVNNLKQIKIKKVLYQYNLDAYDRNLTKHWK